ncbi:SRPBCC family protein [bacterium]|nr:SRPBCC family protein [bacterium]
MISSGSKVWILAALAITTILLAPMSLQSEEIDSMSLINQVQPLNEIRVGKKLFTTSDIIINASPSQVWEVLTDYDRATEIFSNLTKSKIISISGSVKKVAFTVVTEGKLLHFSYVLAITEKRPEIIEWKRASGDFKENEGYWKLTPLNNGKSTLMKYAKHIDGGLFFPQFLVRKSVRSSIPVIFAELKNASELKKVAEGKP